MKHHPYTEIWPLMEGEDFEKLKADIKANGVRIPIVVYNGMVLDGRNRERASEAVFFSPPYVAANARNDAEALELVISLNEHRRHLTFDQRALTAARVANLRHGSNRFEGKLVDASIEASTNGKITISQAAARLKVTKSAVDRAKVIVNNGTAADEAEVVSGKVALSAKAEEITRRTTPYTPRKLVRPATKIKAEPVLQVPRVANPKYLERHEVDPEFTGSAIDFIDKYGHTQTLTAEQFQTMRFSDWAGNMKSLAKLARGLPPLPERPVDHNWLRSPAPNDVAKLTEALEYLRPIMAEAEALLVTAVAALKRKETQDR